MNKQAYRQGFNEACAYYGVAPAQVLNFTKEAGFLDRINPVTQLRDIRNGIGDAFINLEIPDSIKDTYEGLIGPDIRGPISKAYKEYVASRKFVPTDPRSYIPATKRLIERVKSN